MTSIPVLKGDEDEAHRVLEEYVQTREADAVYDDVLLPALCRMRADTVRGAITPDEAAAITRSMQGILDDFDLSALPAAVARDEAGPVPAAAPPTLRVLGGAARDEVDEAAMHILASRLAVDGVEFDTAPASLLAAEVVDRVALFAPAVVVVGAVAPGGLAQGRYVIKRLRARFPELPLIAARWGPPDGRDEARAQLVAAGATEFVATLREARASVLQYRQVETEPAPSRAA
jgi:hypothetical protein